MSEKYIINFLTESVYKESVEKNKISLNISWGKVYVVEMLHFDHCMKPPSSYN